MFNFPCQIEDSIYLKVDLACTIDSLKIPSAFTPNGDNINNEFYVKSRLLNNVIAMDIYNRWGNRVFNVSNVAPNNPLNGWNGKLNNAGEDLPPGMYVYNISATCLNGQTLNFQGEINLIR
jgi:gliding motility-associated-like protein